MKGNHYFTLREKNLSYPLLALIRYSKKNNETYQDHASHTMETTLINVVMLSEGIKRGRSVHTHYISLSLGVLIDRTNFCKKKKKNGSTFIRC